MSDFRLGYFEAGHGEAVVLVPGLGGLGRFWRPVVDELAPRHRVIAVDHPGLGGSSPCERHSIEGIVEGVLQLLDKLDIGRCVVVGHSTGGLAAQALALDHSQRIRAVVLSSTWAAADRRFRDLFRLRQHVLQHAGLAAYESLGQLIGYPAEWYEAQLASNVPPTLAGAHQDEKVTVIHERIDMLLGYSRAESLGQMSLPALVLGAEDDQIVPLSHAYDLQARIPQARLATLRGGHFSPLTRTRDYAATLFQFIRDYT